MLSLEPSMVLVGDTIARMGELPERCVQCCVTSPPYWGLRDYGVDGQIGLEATPDEFVARMVEVFRAVRRVLRDDGTLWLNLGDSYAANTSGGASPQGGASARPKIDVTEYAARRVPSGLKPKDLCGIPWRVVLALQADGWYWRSSICWAKRSPMPESCTDRPTSAWEPIFLLSKSERYFYDAEAVKEQGATGAWAAMPPIGGVKHPGANGNATYSGDTPPSDGSRNMRNVWHLAHEPYSEAHFATFPTEIPRRAIKAGTSEKGCCPVCRSPWRRRTARTKVTRERPNDYTKRGPDGADEGTGNSCANSVAGVSVRTIGWEPGCECGAPYIPTPCLVLDPFLGSGTTVAVARELGRWGAGCELNPRYAELARVRIGKAERPGTFRDMREVVDPEAAPLFMTGRKH